MKSTLKSPLAWESLNSSVGYCQMDVLPVFLIGMDRTGTACLFSIEIQATGHTDI